MTIKKAPRLSSSHAQRGDPAPMAASERQLTLKQPISFSDSCSYERVYVLPPDLSLEPQKMYLVSGWIQDQKKATRIFKFAFWTDSRGLPVAS